MTAMEQVRELEAQGFIVRISHRRPIFVKAPASADFLGAVIEGGTRHDLKMIRHILEEQEVPKENISFWPKGGETEVSILHPSADELYTGVSSCSELDNFNRRRGLQIALGRALKAMKKDPDSEVRPGVWEVRALPAAA